MPNGSVRVTIVSDYICPWCYLGMARIDRLQREFDIDVTWRPFELHPEIPLEARPLGDRVAYYERLRPVAEESGLPFQPPARVPNSHAALEAAEVARENGAFDAYHRALFRAHFAEGRDIGDHEVLAELGAACGIDAAALREALAAKRYARLVDERTEEARRQGITGTPTFIFEDGERRFPLIGAQDYLVFESIARRMGATEKTQDSEPTTTEAPGQVLGPF